MPIPVAGLPLTIFALAPAVATGPGGAVVGPYGRLDGVDTEALPSRDGTREEASLGCPGYPAGGGGAGSGAGDGPEGGTPGASSKGGYGTPTTLEVEVEVVVVVAVCLGSPSPSVRPPGPRPVDVDAVICVAAAVGELLLGVVATVSYRLQPWQGAPGVYPGTVPT
jgi:hypothetical protein